MESQQSILAWINFNSVLVLKTAYHLISLNFDSIKSSTCIGKKDFPDGIADCGTDILHFPGF